MNIYLLLSGVFLIALSVVHAIFGEINVFRTIARSDLEAQTKTSVYVPWHQLTFILLLAGTIQIVAAFSGEYGIISVFVLIIVIGNLVVFLGISIFQKSWLTLRSSVPQYVLFAVIITLSVLGLTKA